MAAKLAYRADIDGLRAVSVVAVLLFHAKVPGFNGGYVGVDVFFVISGFLITSLLLEEQRRGGISFFAFYERRIRRLLPAALPVLIASFVLAYLFYLPQEFEEFAESLMAFFAFGSNFYFLGQAGYFDAPSETKPLLHMWSLSIEEQYYLVLPVMIAVLYTRSRGLLFGFVVVLLATSFAVSQYHVAHEQKALAFYNSLGRFWELLVGSVCAFVISAPIVRKLGQNGVAATILRALGLGLILFAVFWFAPDTPFPGTMALIPVLGAALVVLAGKQSDRLALGLATSPVVYVGKISYSLYLWHWPVVVFSGLIHPAYDLVRWSAVIVLSLALSILSYHFVETPFRRRVVFAGPRWMYGSFASVLLVMVPLAGFVIATDGYPGRLPVGIAKIEEELSLSQDFDKICDESAKLMFVCRFGGAAGDVGDRADVVIVGDSHAGMLDPLVNASVGSQGYSVVSMWRGNCPPLLDVARAGNRACIAAMKDALQRIDKLDPKVVILNGVWPLYWHGTIPAELEKPPVFMAPFRKRSQSVETSVKFMQAGFASFLDELRGRRVLVVLPMPLPSAHVPNEMRRLVLLGLDLERLTIDEQEFRSSNDELGAALRSIAEERNAVVFDPSVFFCKSGRCPVHEDGYPLYADTNHLAPRGLTKIEDEFGFVLLGALGSVP